jgi:hypothetical protein
MCWVNQNFAFHFQTIFKLLVFINSGTWFNYKNGPNYSIVNGFQEE